MKKNKTKLCSRTCLNIILLLLFLSNILFGHSTYLPDFKRMRLIHTYNIETKGQKTLVLDTPQVLQSPRGRDWKNRNTLCMYLHTGENAMMERRDRHLTQCQKTPGKKNELRIYPQSLDNLLKGFLQENQIIK